MAPDQECLRAHRNDCDGALGVRYSALGTPITECQKHMEESEAKNAATAERYPDTDIAPVWFDESIAGEHWGSDY